MIAIKKKCEYCDHEFFGINERQVDAQILVHKMHRHNDKVQFREVKRK